MAAGEDEEDARRPDRLWRVEQRQVEIIARLERLQNRLDENAQRREAHEWRLDNFCATVSKQLDELIKRPSGGGLLGEPTFIKMLIIGIITLAVVAITGRLYVFGG